MPGDKRRPTGRQLRTAGSEVAPVDTLSPSEVADVGPETAEVAAPTAEVEAEVAASWCADPVPDAAWATLAGGQAVAIADSGLVFALGSDGSAAAGDHLVAICGGGREVRSIPIGPSVALAVDGEAPIVFGADITRYTANLAVDWQVPVDDDASESGAWSVVAGAVSKTGAIAVALSLTDAARPFGRTVVARGAGDAVVVLLGAGGAVERVIQIGSVGATVQPRALTFDAAGELVVAVAFSGVVDFGEGARMTGVATVPSGGIALLGFGAEDSPPWVNIPAATQGTTITGLAASAVGIVVGGALPNAGTLSWGGDVAAAPNWGSPYVALLDDTGVARWALLAENDEQPTNPIAVAAGPSEVAYSFEGYRLARVVRLGRDGERMGVRAYGEAGVSPSALAFDAAGGLHMTGRFEGILDVGGAANLYRVTGDRFVAYLGRSVVDPAEEASVSGLRRLVSATTVAAGIADTPCVAASVPDGEAWIAGTFRDTLALGDATLIASADAIFLTRLDAKGALADAQVVAGPNSNIAVGGSLVGMDDGGVLIAGTFGYGAGGEASATFDAGGPTETTLRAHAPAAFVARTTAGGGIAWARSPFASASLDTDLDQIRLASAPSGGDYSVAANYSRDIVLADGKVLAGDANGTWNDRALIATYSADGALLWCRSLIADDYGLALVSGIGRGADGSVYVTGSYRRSVVFGKGEANETTLTSTKGPSNGLQPGAPGQDIFVARFGSDGQLLWAKGAGGKAQDLGQSLVVASDGGVYVVGWFSAVGPYLQPATFGAGEPNETTVTADLHLPYALFVARYGADGRLAWAKTAPNAQMAQSQPLLAPDGTLLLIAYVATPWLGEQPWALSSGEYLLNFGPDGALASERFLGPGATFFGLAVTAAGDAVLAGSFREWATIGLHDPTETSLMSDAGGLIFARYAPAH